MGIKWLVATEGACNEGALMAIGLEKGLVVG